MNPHAANLPPVSEPSRRIDPGRRVRRAFAATMAAAWVFVALPWIAPALMQGGQTPAATALYRVYGLLCHQLPQRSLFLFGPQVSYSLAELSEQGVDTSGLLALRAFAGSPGMGYKVAWSDRMVTLYTSIPLTALAWWPLRRKLRPLAPVLAVVLMLPMVVDGLTHTVSDLAGLGQGFRDSNAWLVALSGGRVPTAFAAGDQLGSLNSLLRLGSGALFGSAAVLTACPRLVGRPEREGRL